MVAQFPLGMGREQKAKSNALPVQMDAEGRIKFDNLLRQGQPKNKVIHSKFTDLVEKQIKADDDPDLMRPDEETRKEVVLHSFYLIYYFNLLFLFFCKQNINKSPVNPKPYYIQTQKNGISQRK